MTNRSTSTRRRLLKLTGSAAAVGLAGCTSLGSQTNDGEDDSGEDDGGAGQGADDHDESEDDHDESEDDHGEEGDHDESEGDHGEEGDHDESEGDHDESEGDHDESEDDHDESEDDHDDHGHNHDEGSPEEPSPAAEVTMATEGQQHHYQPHVVWIEPGGTVTWELESGSHDVVAYHPDNDRPLRMPEDADPWSSGLLSDPGATVEHTFETEGVYDYYCTPHEGLGMVGTVIVGQPDPHNQPALAEPQQSLPDGASAELADLGETVNDALGHMH